MELSAAAASIDEAASNDWVACRPHARMSRSKARVWFLSASPA
jgi:hypothetical protein